MECLQCHLSTGFSDRLPGNGSDGRTWLNLGSQVFLPTLFQERCDMARGDLECVGIPYDDFIYMQSALFSLQLTLHERSLTHRRPIP